VAPVELVSDKPTVAQRCREGAIHPIIAESPQEIAELSALFRAGDLENRLEVAAHELKRKYPKADKAELTNYMVTAYCPIIAADRDLSELEKRERLDQFSERVWNIYRNLGP
jgi:hypothetical protein